MFFFRRAFIMLFMVFHFNPHQVFSQEIENQIIERYESYQSNNPVEYAYLKTNQKVYYSGSLLDFSLIVFDQYLSPSLISEIVHLELIHENGAFHEKYIFRLDSGLLNSHIDLPLNIPTGNYQLIAYTYFMKNHDIDRCAQRVPIYIQNTLDNTQPVVESISYEKQNDFTIDRPDEINFEIDIKEDASNLYVELSSIFDKKGFYYLVGEGFQSLQFVAKVKLKKNRVNLSIPKSQLIGGFQKLIVLNEDMQVLAARPFYLRLSSNDSNIQTESNGTQIKGSFQDNFYSSLSITDKTPYFRMDTIGLFRRIYELYYTLPSYVKTNHMGFAEMTAQSTLKKYSKYSFEKWKTIYDVENANRKVVEYYPEKNIQIRGKIDGNEVLVKGASIAIHFFHSGLEVVKPLRRLGDFSIDINLPISNDLFYATILDENGKDISNGFDLFIMKEHLSEYTKSVNYHASSRVDSLINENKKFNYILSTYYKISKPQPLFWENGNIIFDDVIKVEDYRGLKNFEEFIREAVVNVFMAKNNGKKSLNILNVREKKYESPQLLILNDHVLKESTPLFDIPLSKIESLHVTYDDNSLKQMGSAFVRGILAVKTYDQIEIDEKYVDNNFFRKFTGYTNEVVKNTIAEEFNKSKALQVSTKKQQLKEVKTDAGDILLLNLEMIDIKGNYYQLTQDKKYK